MRYPTIFTPILHGRVRVEISQLFFTQCSRISHLRQRLIDSATYAVARAAGGLEGPSPSKNPFLGSWLAAKPPASCPKERFRGGRVPSGCLPEPLHRVSPAHDKCQPQAIGCRFCHLSRNNPKYACRRTFYHYNVVLCD